jgi:hypothetical protein
LINGVRVRDPALISLRFFSKGRVFGACCIKHLEPVFKMT